MNFNEAKDYLYNRYKNNFELNQNFYVGINNIDFFSNSFGVMTLGEYGIYIYSFSVLENGQPVWHEMLKDLTIKKHFSDDVIECKLKKIKKYIDDELLALNEIKKNLLKTKIDQL